MFDYFSQELGQRPPITIKTITRHSAFFALGIFVSQLVRVIPELQPLFWILALSALVWLVYAIRAKQDIGLMAIAAIVVAALLAGHWDGLFHHTAQGLANLEEGIR